jgi:hypothetical protein
MSEPASEPMTPQEPAQKSDGKFKPGQSGNSRGRPRKPKTVDGSIEQAMGVKIPVTEGGKRKRVTRQDAVATQIAAQGAGGDLRAAKMAIDLMQRAEDRAASTPLANDNLSEPDVLVVERLILRLRLIDQEAEYVAALRSS